VQNLDAVHAGSPECPSQLAEKQRLDHFLAQAREMPAVDCFVVARWFAE
jgi:hypothetical protein